MARKRVLKAEFSSRCNGCELCVLEAQRQLKKVGIEGSPIRILRSKSQDSLNFSVDLDPRVNELDIEKIKSICPTLVFTITEQEEYELLQ